MTTIDAERFDNPPTEPKKKRDKTHWLYIAVIIAVIAGIIVGLVAKDFASDLSILGTLFVSLIKMMISPVIFCTIVLGIGSVRAAASVGRVGGLALAYFIGMSTIALGIGMVVGNLIKPGDGLNITPNDAGLKLADTAHEAGGTMDFIAMGKQGEGILKGIGAVQKLVFRILTMILWLAPIGAFGAIAGVVGKTGFDAVIQLGTLMLAFYITCFIFVFFFLGLILKFVSGFSIFKLVKYLAREYLLIVATSSSESALPRLIAKMEHVGVERTTVGIVVPTGYSFNLDGTAIYLTMASIFIADAMNMPLSIGEQFSLLLFMIIASKGAAGVSGAGLATLAGGLSSHRPELLDGVQLIVGIDRFMSEARAVTNFSGNAVATLLVGTWTKTIDAARVTEVLDGKHPFDEETMVDDHLPEDDRPADKQLIIEKNAAKA